MTVWFCSVERFIVWLRLDECIYIFKHYSIVLVLYDIARYILYGVIVVLLFFAFLATSHHPHQHGLNWFPQPGVPNLARSHAGFGVDVIHGQWMV